MLKDNKHNNETESDLNNTENSLDYTALSAASTSSVQNDDDIDTSALPDTENPNPSIPLSDREITSHTAGMWKYNVIPDSPLPYPEYVNNYEKNENAEIIAAKVRGKKHKHEGSNCDDWYEYKFIENWIIAVVADGAGSKPLSRIGAKISCEAVISCLEREFSAVLKESPDIAKKLSLPMDNPEFTEACTKIAFIMQGSLNEAYSAVENEHLKLRESEELIEYLERVPELKDFSSTLLCTAVIPVDVNGKKEHFVISIQIGDGMIASVNADVDFNDALRILGNADSGHFAGETEFLLSPQMRSADSLMGRTKIQRRKITSVMLMSDGVADDYYPNNPQLLRLYLDLKLNDILSADWTNNKLTDVNRPYASLVPKPIEYPWVNDSDVIYSLQYTNNVINKTGLSLEQLWNKDMSDILKIASLKSFDIVHENKDKSAMLSIWLDNYVERGSFDDRTLVIINVIN